MQITSQGTADAAERLGGDQQ